MSPWLLALVVAWVIGFQWLFFRQSLQDPDIPRTDLWLMLADEILGVESAGSETAATAAGPEFLSQRVPIFIGALCLLGLALAHGWLLDEAFLSGLSLTGTERFVTAAGSGLGLLSTVTLLSGLAGQLSCVVLAVPSVASGILAMVLRRRRRNFPGVLSPQLAMNNEREPRWIPVLVCLIGIPFLVYLFLGAVSPPTDFDVREYHLQGPKEWFQEGRISYLRHNVYTSFPFLSEMLCLAGMVVANDWWSGALTGQVLLAVFQLLTSLAVYSTGRRWFGGTVGWLSALICLTTPWTLRISLISYAEGALTFYLMAALMLSMVLVRQPQGQVRSRCQMVVGLLAGSAMASKYTGLIQVIIPVALLWVISCWRMSCAMDLSDGRVRMRRELCREGLIFAAGVFVAIGPWLVKNGVETGNPVFPMAYSVFGGTEWNESLNERWKRAHGAPEHSLERVPQHFLDAAVRNKWTSSLLFGLGLPSVLLWRRRLAIRVIVLTTAWGFFTWWALTHRIDRFWIPMIPLLSLGAGSVWLLSPHRSWRWLLLTTILASTTFNVRFCTLSLVGFHADLMDLDEARQMTIRSDIQALNRELSRDSRVLMVGEAEVFDAEFPLLYNTVFDDSVFEEIAKAEHSGTVEGPVEMKPAEAIRAELQSRGVTHVLVNWKEILRYRLPGSYGYSEFVQPSRFQTLSEQGVLTEPDCLLRADWELMSEMERGVVREWQGWEVLVRGTEFRSVLLYRVR
jgi:4-amino-4-deoxy-L-arabinose transferase-like glycosyltransferase